MLTLTSPELHATAFAPQTRHKLRMTCPSGEGVTAQNLGVASRTTGRMKVQGSGNVDGLQMVVVFMIRRTMMERLERG